MLIIFQRCCPQCRKIIGFVAYNADYFSMLLPTTRKSTLISVHMCFSALLPTTSITFPCCGSQRGKIIGVVAYTTETLSALLPTMRKNVRIWISPRIRNHMWIYTRVSIRGLGWCVSWRKVEVKNLVELSFKSGVDTICVCIPLFKVKDRARSDDFVADPRCCKLWGKLGWFNQQSGWGW